MDKQARTPRLRGRPRVTTLDEVAEHAGVSRMTVSRVLRGHGSFSADAKRRVLDAVEAVGYVPNRLAGALASARSTQVAVIIPTIGNIVFTEVMSGINAELVEAGLQGVLGVTEYEAGREEALVEGMLSWRPAGLIIAGLEHGGQTRRLLAKAGIPVVEIMDVDDEPVDMCVGLSHVEAGHVTARHFVARGYTRIGYVACDLALDLRAGKRLKGFEEVLSAHGLAIAVTRELPLPTSVPAGQVALAELMADHPDLDAVYFSNDDLAIGAVLHCLSAGIAMPDTIAIAGFNGLVIGQLLPRRLTTVRSPRFSMGRQAARCVVDRLAGKDAPERIDTGFEFLAGETA